MRVTEEWSFWGSAPIPQSSFLAMGLPAMIGMMINALYNLVDAYFVGGLGTSQMGAICGISAWADSGRTGTAVREHGAASYISRLLGYGEKKLRIRLQAQRCTAVCLPAR